MSSATYEFDNLYSTSRVASLQRPFQLFIISGDFLLILFSYLLSTIICRRITGASAEQEIQLGAGLITGIVFVTLVFFQGGYDRHHLVDANWQARKVFFMWMLSLTILAVAAFLLRSTAILSCVTITLFATIGLVSLGAHRAVWRIAMASPFAKILAFNRGIVLLSPKPIDFTSTRFKDLRMHGFDVVQHIVLNVTLRDNDAAWDREISTIIRLSRAVNAEEFLLAIDWSDLPILPKVTQRLRQVPKPIRLLPDFLIADLVSRPFVPASGTMAIEIQRTPLSIFERLQKRCLDVSVASVALLLLAPLLIMTAILIKLESSGSVIFRQTRGGFNDKLFDIWKFRSMTVSENGCEVRQARKQDARVTRVGRLLRKTSIDELPQLWNVLRGDMSLVGPRPHALAHDNYYDQIVRNYAYRHHVKPGLTGWAQVNGFRGETPTIDLMEKRVEYDVWYVANWSIWLDIRIMVRTAMFLLAQQSY